MVDKSFKVDFQIWHKLQFNFLPPDSLRYAKKFNQSENDLLHSELKKFVQLHIDTIDLCELMTRSLGPIVFLHFIAASILICASCLLLVLADGAEKLIYVNFLVGTFADVFLHGYVGTRLIEASLGIREAAYDLEWYKCDVRNQKLILMIMLRARRAVAVKMPFFNASLETFITVSDVQERILKIDVSFHSTDCAVRWVIHHPSEDVFVVE